MKKWVIFLVAVSFSGALASGAQARTIHLHGKAADDFIARHFPNAAIPGPVKGVFAYRKAGHIRHGQANCNVPAMGARSDGAVSTCRVHY